MATAMQYGRNADASITYMYGLEARESLGSVLRGSYNTFLAQSSELWLVNATGSSESAALG